MPVPGDGLWLIYSIVTILFPAILAFFATSVGNGSWFRPRRPKWKFAGRQSRKQASEKGLTG